MDISMSLKLSEFFNYVQKETGREIYLEVVENMELGFSAAFIAHPEIIHIQIAKTIDVHGYENSLAHEATHGLLVYGRMFYQPELLSPVTSVVSQGITLAMTMIEDVVVNKIIYDYGFEPFSPVYLPQVEIDTKKTREGKLEKMYLQFQGELHEKFFVFRYIFAWSIFNLYELPQFQKRILKKFINAFEENYPKLHALSIPIKNLFLEYDIFSKEGHEIIMRETLQLWGYEKYLK